jgi:hypothetical protein
LNGGAGSPAQGPAKTRGRETIAAFVTAPLQKALMPDLGVPVRHSQRPIGSGRHHFGVRFLIPVACLNGCHKIDVTTYSDRERVRHVVSRDTWRVN